MGRASLARPISVASASRSAAAGDWAGQRGPSRQPAGFGPGSTQALERRKTGELWGEPGSKSTWLVPGDFPGLSPLGDQLVSMAIPTPLAELEGPLGVTWSSPTGGSRRERPAPASTWQDECGPAATGSPLEPDQLCLTLPPGLYWFPAAHRTVSKSSACTPDLTRSQLHLCLLPKPCSTTSLSLRLCLEGLPKPHLSKSCSNTPLLQEAFPESLRLSSALAYLLSRTPPRLSWGSWRIGAGSDSCLLTGCHVTELSPSLPHSREPSTRSTDRQEMVPRRSGLWWAKVETAAVVGNRSPAPGEPGPSLEPHWARGSAALLASLGSSHYSPLQPQQGKNIPGSQFLQL